MPAVMNVDGRLMSVSVVVPAYNASQTLGSCLDALTRQTYPRDSYEIIVVDDGSTDSTAEVAGRYPVSYLHQENRGPATARNVGAATGSGEILLFTDSDCIPTVDWIEEMVAPFRQDEVMAVKGAYRTRQREIVARFAQIEFEERFTLLEKAGKTDMVDTYSAGYRHHIFTEFGGFDTRFPVANNEDTELSYRMATMNVPMVFNPRAIVYHLGHPNSVIHYARLKFGRGYWRMAVYRQFPEKMLRDTYTPKSLKIQIVALFLLFCTLPLPIVSNSLGLPALAAAMLFFGSSIASFVLIALRKDAMVGLCAPFLLAVRAASLGLGALWGSRYARL